MLFYRFRCWTASMWDICAQEKWHCDLQFSGFLPSTFSMYAITLASALVLLGDRHKTVVAVAAAGVLVGWPFAALAAAPLVVYSLMGGGFLHVFLAGLLTTLCTMVSLVFYITHSISTSLVCWLFLIAATKCLNHCCVTSHYFLKAVWRLMFETGVISVGRPLFLWTMDVFSCQFGIL